MKTKFVFVEKKRDIDWYLTLWSFEKPFQIFHADVADLRFLATFAVDPKYCFLFVDLFTSKVYTYPMKNRSPLSQQNEIVLQGCWTRKKRWRNAVANRQRTFAEQNKKILMHNTM